MAGEIKGDANKQALVFSDAQVSLGIGLMQLCAMNCFVMLYIIAAIIHRAEAVALCQTCYVEVCLV